MVEPFHLSDWQRSFLKVAIGPEQSKRFPLPSLPGRVYHPDHVFTDDAGHQELH